MAWMVLYDIGTLVLGWIASWYTLKIAPWSVYGFFQSMLFNFCVVLFVILVVKGWRMPILRKVCYYIYGGSHLWEKTSGTKRELSVMNGSEENIRCEFCVRCHRTRISFILNDMPRRYVAEAEDKHMTKEY